MSLIQFYTDRILNVREKLHKIQKQEERLSFLRLGTFILPVVLFFLLLDISTIASIVILISGLSLFGFVLKRHLETTRQRIYIQHLLSINEKELACIQGNFSFFPNGEEFKNKNHPYSGDLDIFGNASLFQFINRTASDPGSKLLAQWLNAPAPLNEIIYRQEAVTELKDYTEWRQQLMTVGYKYTESANDPESILTWANEVPLFLNKYAFVAVTKILSLLLFASVVGWFFGLPGIVVTALLVINASIVYREGKNVNSIHQRVAKTFEMIKSYGEAITLIENQEFKCSPLRLLQQKFRKEDSAASGQINKLSALVNKLDYRLNILVSVPLNLFLFWDIRQVYKLEKWKELNKENLSEWFSAMAGFEALNSLANLYFNHPDWIMPKVTSGPFRLQAQKAGHPLIPAERRIDNDLEIDDKGRIILITGSNMSGKSTFLRTCGVNIVLAMAGAPVCAGKFEISHVLVFTSMRIADSLEENTSSFYAELKRLASIIQTVERKENVFLLLDEILRGTNSNDRHIGSVALIRQFIKNEASAIIATHDLALSHLEEEMPGRIDNYNFDVKIENDELFFDYKLNKGICKSLNASILMKKMGIRIDS